MYLEMSPDCIQLHWLAGPPLDTEWSCYKRREWLVMPMMCVRSASPSAWCVDMGGGFLLSTTSQTKNPTWILRCDDTHIVQSNSNDLFGYDVVATAGEVQRPGHRTLIVSIALLRTL